MSVLGGPILRSNIPRNGLEAEYLANDNFLDTSGNDFTAINIGGNVIFGDDRASNPDSAFVLNGSDACINIDAALAGLLTNTKGTLSKWAKPVDATPPAPNFLLSFGDTDANTFILLDLLTSGRVRFKARLAGVDQWEIITDDPVLSNGVWSHIGGVQNAVSPIIYIDGTPVDQTFTVTVDKTIWFNDLPGIDNGRIGCGNFNSGGDVFLFDGDDDDDRIYNRDLSQSEMTALANE